MKLAAEYMVKKLDSKGKVVILEGTPGASTAQDRKRAINDVLKKSPGIEVLASQPALFQRAEGMKVAENLLVRFPKIDAILACNDEMALGAIQAVEAAGRQKEIMVSGFDANNDAIKAVAAGKLVVTLDQQPELQASKALEALVQYLKGEKNVQERIVTDATLVDFANVAQYVKKRGL